MAWYMARYTSGKMKAFFYIAVMLPMWASYIVKAYAWTLLLAKDGVAQWFLQHLGLEPLLTAFPVSYTHLFAWRAVCTKQSVKPVPP